MKNITICYHANVFEDTENGTVMLKQHWGRYFDDMARSFKLSIICASDTKRARFQDYYIKNKSINVISLHEKGSFRKLVEISHAFQQTINNTNVYYILMPSNTGILMALLCWIRKKKYCLYYGLEPFRNGDSWLKIQFTKLILLKSKFSIGTGDQVTTELARYTKKVFKTKPNILFEMDDIVDREFDNEDLKLVYVGEVSQRKGLEFLIKAIHQLKNSSKFDSLKIVGVGPALDKIKALVETLGLSTKVQFLGYLNDKDALREVYLTSNVFILPSFEEGFPRVLYEAMIFGLIIVTTPVNSVPSIIKDRVNGFHVEPGSSESIYSVLSEIANDTFRGNEMLRVNREKLKNLIECSAVDQHIKFISREI